MPDYLLRPFVAGDIHLVCVAVCSEGLDGARLRPLVGQVRTRRAAAEAVAAHLLHADIHQPSRLGVLHW